MINLNLSKNIFFNFGEPSVLFSILSLDFALLWLFSSLVFFLESEGRLKSEFFFFLSPSGDSMCLSLPRVSALLIEKLGEISSEKVERLGARSLVQIFNASY